MKKIICFIVAILVLNLCACSSSEKQSASQPAVETSAAPLVEASTEAQVESTAEPSKEAAPESSAETSAENTEQKSDSEYRNTVDGYEITRLPDSFKSPNVYFLTDAVDNDTVMVSVFEIFPEEGHTVEEAVNDMDLLRAAAFIGTIVFSNEGNEVDKDVVADYYEDPELFREIVRNDGHNLIIYEGTEQDHIDIDKATQEEKEAAKAAAAEFEELAKNVVPGVIEYPKLSFKTIDFYGNPITSEECFSDNDVTLLNCWASYCGPCEREMPSLVEADEQLKSDNCHVVLCLFDTDSRESEEYQDAVELLNRAGAQNLKCIIINDEIQEQLGDYVAAYPTSYPVGSDGQVLGPQYDGDRSVESFVDWVKSYKSGQ